MPREWTYEADTTNSISIKLDGNEQLQLVREYDLNPEDVQMAEFVVDALNEKEARQ